MAPYAFMVWVLHGKAWKNHYKKGFLCSVCCIRWPCLAVQLAILDLRLRVLDKGWDEAF